MVFKEAQLRAHVDFDTGLCAFLAHPAVAFQERVKRPGGVFDVNTFIVPGVIVIVIGDGDCVKAQLLIPRNDFGRGQPAAFAGMGCVQVCFDLVHTGKSPF